VTPWQPLFELTFRPDPELVTVVRRFVNGLYDRILDGDAAARVAMATHELLENTVKYSLDGRASVTIALSRNGHGGVLSICTRNRASDGDVRNIAGALDEMRAVGDPARYYQLVLRRTAAREIGSGLGLARVYAEGEMTMRYQLAAEELSIVAETVVAARESP